MEIGNDVIFQKFDGEEVREFDAIVIGGNDSELSLSYLNLDKRALLGSVDWRLAFERIDQVKHFQHEDVQAGKEGFAYRLESEGAPDPAESVSNPPEEPVAKKFEEPAEPEEEEK